MAWHGMLHVVRSKWDKFITPKLAMVMIMIEGVRWLFHVDMDVDMGGPSLRVWAGLRFFSFPAG